MWESSLAITDDDIEMARIAWKQRRASRITSQDKTASSEFSIQNLDLSSLRDRLVYLVIYRDWLSKEAVEAYRLESNKITGKDTSSEEYPPIYEDWPAIPENAELIDLYFGRRGALNCYGIFKRAWELKFKYRNGKQGHIVVCEKKETALGFAFGNGDATALAKYFKPHINAIWTNAKAEGSSDGKIISLADALDICG